MKRVFIWLILSCVVANAQIAPIPYFVGPQDPSQIINYLNTLINEINIRLAGINGGGSSGGQVFLTNSTGSTAKGGAAAYVNGAGTFALAVASAYSTSGVVALVSSDTLSGLLGTLTVSGPLTLTTAGWDAVTGGSMGLTTGSIYFLDPTTPGRITATPPTTVGQLVTVVGRATSPTELVVSIGTPFQL